MRRIFALVLFGLTILLTTDLEAQTVFTRTAAGMWTDTNWSQSPAFPNGSNDIADLVVPNTGAQNLDLAGGGWTVGQLKLTGSGTGTWVLVDGNVASMAPVTVQAGTLELTNGGGIIGDFVDDGTIVTDWSFDVNYTGSISGTGGGTKLGSSILTLSGNDTYFGPTTVSAGTLQAGSTTGFSSNSAFTVHAVLDLNGFNNTIGSLSGTGSVTNNGGALAVLTVGNDNTSTTFSGTLTDGASCFSRRERSAPI